MRKTGVILILLIIFFQLAHAGRQERVDSIKALIEQTESDSAKTRLYILLGTEVRSNTPDESLDYFTQARKLAEKIKDTTYLVKSILGISDFYSLVSEYSTSLELAFQALSLSENNSKLLSLCHSRLAGVHHMLEEFDQALLHNRIALALDKQNKDTSRIAIDYHRIGTLFLENDKFDSAIYYLHLANSYAIKMNGKSDSYDLSHLGHTYTYMGVFDSALYYHFEAFKYDSLDERSYEMSVDEYYIAFTYLKKGTYDKAVAYAQRSINRGKDLKLFEIMLYNYELLYEVFEKRGDYKNAFEYALLRNNYADSLRDKSKESLIQSLEVKYKFEDQERQLKSAEAENRLLLRQKTLLIILSVVSLLLLVSTFVIIIQKNRRQKANRELLLELEKANLSKERLISIISHDLRGSIGTLRNAVEFIIDDKLDFKTSRELMQSFFPVVDSTYDLLENLLTWAKYGKENLEPLFEEVDMKSIIEKSVLHTSHLATSKNIEIVNNVENIVVLADRNMLLMVVRNLISNAIKFSHPKSKVYISCATAGNIAELTVKDEGVGMKEEVLQNIFNTPVDYHSKGTMGERGSGLGLSICKIFIEKQGGQIWASRNPEKGSSLYFTIPLALKN
jgi:signal transduction histidine kinase